VAHEQCGICIACEVAGIFWQNATISPCEIELLVLGFTTATKKGKTLEQLRPAYTQIQRDIAKIDQCCNLLG